MYSPLYDKAPNTECSQADKKASLRTHMTVITHIQNQDF